MESLRRSLSGERQERKDAQEQQAATAEILRVISSSPTDVQPVFDAIVRSGLNLFPNATVVVTRPEGGHVQLAAIASDTPDRIEEWKNRFPIPLSRNYMQVVAILDRKVVDVPDADANDDRSIEAGIKNFLAIGYRAITIMPMLRGDRAIGAISVVRAQPGPLAEKQLALLRTFADQAVIAIENVRLFNETKEALEQQTASSEVLEVISRSPSELGPVFDAILGSATRLCGAHLALLNLYDGENYRTVAQRGGAPDFAKWVFERGAFKPEPVTTLARVVKERQPILIPDMRETPAYRAGVVYTLKFVELGGARTYLLVPLLRDDKVLGVIAIYRSEVSPFTDKQIDLVKTFAKQAVIAIENVRLFNETKEALDQQTASGEVLGAISNSIADTRPVFDKILEGCERLFEGQFMSIGLAGEDGLVHVVARRGVHSQDQLREVSAIPLSRESGAGTAILEGRIMHYPNLLGQRGLPPVLRSNTEKAGLGSIIFAPMFWENRAIGAIWVGRSITGVFTEKQIALLKTFADQAVIAIQNARLFREIREKSAQLEVANKHKSDFLANMSHELRTPLNAIIGFSEGLMARMFGELNEKQADYLKDIHESGKHLLSLINDILDLSKIEAGKMELELSTFHLPSAVSNAVTLVRERAHRHGITIGVDIDPRLGEFEADQRKLKQVLLNLLSNAVKFTPESGRVDVSAKLDTDKVEIAIKDTGVGIAPEDQASLFEEFKQLGKDSSRKAEGTGLGLALTRRLVELHGGEISVQSVLGKGTTFRVNLPLRR